MQLEDVERLEKLRIALVDAREARQKPTGARGPSFFERHVAMLTAEAAWRDALLADGPALLALAREALERRRDAAPRPVTAAESAVLRRALLDSPEVVHEGERRDHA